MLPHIKNSTAGVNRQDPVYKNMFEAYFTLPEALQAEFGSDIAVLTEQVQKVSGLDSLNKTVEAGEQKFLGTSRSYLNSKLDSTFHELSIEIALNMRERTDNYIFKLLKAWASLGYNLFTGETGLKRDYVADWFKLSIANRAGDIYREVIYKDVMLTELTGWDEADYTTNDVVTMTIKLRSDWAEETNA